MRQRLNILDLGLVTCLLRYCCTCVDHLSPGFENPYILRPSPSNKVIFGANVISTRFCTEAPPSNMWWWWCRNPKYPQWEVFPRPCLLFFLLDKERPHHQPTVTTHASHFYQWRIFLKILEALILQGVRKMGGGILDRGHCCLMNLVG